MSAIERLIYMANQIARNFATRSADDAALAVADHIASFWDPRMRTALARYEADDGAALLPVVRAAIVALQTRGPPPHQTRATETIAGGSDAG